MPGMDTPVTLPVDVGPWTAAPFDVKGDTVFAIGDVRSGSIKRVAAAVGEGAQVVAALHAYLAKAERNPAILTSH